jgi:Asp-tRNA(Asn)/Glu-tRNA(Gln) amidotransferase C subunit
MEQQLQQLSKKSAHSSSYSSSSSSSRVRKGEEKEFGEEKEALPNHAGHEKNYIVPLKY